MSATGTADVGPLLREWRQRRRITQLELALDSGVSTRHLSFVETGRSKPGREMLLRVLERLDLPYRERNQILLAAGHAPAFPERPLGDPALAPVRDALDKILSTHEPFPAIAFDRSWNLVASNDAAGAVFGGVEVDPALLEPPVNVLRLGLHPRGLAPLILNLPRWRAHFVRRLTRQVTLTGDGDLAALLEEIESYPAGDDGEGSGDANPDDALGPVRVRVPGGREWSFFGMFAGFDTPFDVTTSELALELLYPADKATEEALRKGTP
jgi:transcriptional regulator with XRE-family HTH domain